MEHQTRGNISLINLAPKSTTNWRSGFDDLILVPACCFPPRQELWRKDFQVLEKYLSTWEGWWWDQKCWPGARGCREDKSWNQKKMFESLCYMIIQCKYNSTTTIQCKNNSVLILRAVQLGRLVNTISDWRGTNVAVIERTWFIPVINERTWFEPVINIVSNITVLSNPAVVAWR